MLYRSLLSGALGLACCYSASRASAQQVPVQATIVNGGAAVGPSNPFPVTGAGGTASNPPTGAINQTTVTCGTGSTTLLAAGAATNFIQVVPPIGATNTVWINWAGVAAVAAPPSQSLGAGVSQSWTSYIPNAQANCISTPAGQAVTLIYK